MAKAAVTRSIRDDHQKNFLKIFNGLTGKHSRWEIWEDFVTLTAIEISNSTDKVNATERTKMYQTIISKYSAKERDGMAEMLAEVVMGMEQNPDQDFLGSLYMMCELGNDHAGQFFTPCDVCRCMAEITFDPKLHPDMEGFISVSDPACGAGATLLAFLNVCKRRNICYHNKVLVMAQDIDFIVGLMCYIQCSFMGCAGSYDPKKVNLVMNGKIITGFASDSMITIARNEDTVTTQVGVKGDVAYNENANESGTITVTLMGTSSSLPYVRSLALKRKEVSVMIVDANDSASVNVAEERCRVIKPPDITRAKEIGSESVSIFVPSLNYR